MLQIIILVLSGNWIPILHVSNQTTTALSCLQSAAKRLRVRPTIEGNKNIALTETRKGGMMPSVYNVRVQDSELQRF